MSPRQKPAIKKIARTIYLPEPLNKRLTDEAAQRGYSGNDLVIMALEAFLRAAPIAVPIASPVPTEPLTDDEGMADF